MYRKPAAPYDHDYYKMIVDLWNKPMTGEAIAMLLGKTKGSIIGVVHRARLKGFNVETHPRKHRPRTSNTFKIAMEEKLSKEPVRKPVSLGKVKDKPIKLRLVKPVEKPNEAYPYGVPIVDSKSDGCKFPIESNGDKHLFCNQKNENGSYCKTHAEIVYTKVQGKVPYANWGIRHAR